MHHAVELLTAPGGDGEHPLRHPDFGERYVGEMSFAIHCVEYPARAKVLAAVLDLIARFAEMLDAVIHWYDPGDLLANRMRAGEGEAIGQLRFHPTGKI